MTDESKAGNEQSNEGASVAPVMALPVQPMNGIAAVTVRVPVPLVEALRRMKPNVDFATAVTLLANEAVSWAARQQAYDFASAENGFLKTKLAESSIERWRLETALQAEKERVR